LLISDVQVAGGAGGGAKSTGSTGAKATSAVSRTLYIGALASVKPRLVREKQAEILSNIPIRVVLPLRTNLIPYSACISQYLNGGIDFRLIRRGYVTGGAGGAGAGDGDLSRFQPITWIFWVLYIPLTALCTYFLPTLLLSVKLDGPTLPKLHSFDQLLILSFSIPRF
jgi:hypothetical protein